MVTPGELTAPVGLLNPEWFDDLEGQLEAYIQNPEVAGKPDAVVRSYAYWRAYSQLAADLMSEPASQRDLNKSSQWTSDQLGFWQAQAEHWRCAYQTALNPVVPMAIGVAR